MLLDLSQDLYRVAMGRQRGQVGMARVFAKEAEARIGEIGDVKYGDKIVNSLASKEERSAEDLLMYSTIIKNYSLKL